MTFRFRDLRAACVAALCAAVWASHPAHADDDQPFVTLYSTDIEAAGRTDLEQWLFWKTNHAAASYNEYLSETEVEYGITDNFQGSIYLKYDRSRERPAGGPADADSFVGTQL